MEEMQGKTGASDDGLMILVSLILVVRGNYRRSAGLTRS